MPLPFVSPWLLAPMEGITEPCFRDLVLERNPPATLGGVFTEFVRVVDYPVPEQVLAKHLGPHRFEAPVGLQLLGADLPAMEATAANAIAAGAPLVDINCGCPARGALRGRAGSALLDDPGRLERVVAACVRGVAGAAPVTAKIRAGIEDDSRVEELARAVEEGGAELLTIHCRTRDEKFQKEVDWTRITRAVNSVSIPVCGNGGIGTHTDLARMLEEVGCAYAMVGQAALGDPWIFSGIEVSRGEAARFLLEYAATLEERGTTSRQGVAGRIKQLLRHWTAGDLLRGELRDWLVEESTEGLLARLEAATR